VGSPPSKDLDVETTAAELHPFLQQQKRRFAVWTELHERGMPNEPDLGRVLVIAQLPRPFLERILGDEVCVALLQECPELATFATLVQDTRSLQRSPKKLGVPFQSTGAQDNQRSQVQQSRSTELHRSRVEEHHDSTGISRLTVGQLEELLFSFDRAP